MNFRIIIGLLYVVMWTSCSSGKDENIPANPTFNEHVAALMHEKCVSCHRIGGSAPFSLVTYKEVIRKKKTIRKVTQSGYMPPWPADPAYSHFIGEKYLTMQEKALIKKWVDNGAPEGTGNPIANLKQYYPNSIIGKPDVTLYLDSIHLEGNSLDKFLIVKIPFQLEQDTFIRAIEFVPGPGNLVHHMNGHLLVFDWDKKKDVFGGSRVVDTETKDYQEFIEKFSSLQLYNDDGSKPERIHSAVNFLPGVEAQLYPEGIGGYKVSRKGTLVANDIHYGPVPKNRWDHSRINIFFSKKAPERPTLELMLGTNGVSKINPPLVIEAGKVKSFRTSYVVQEDISILTINPHMHLLGKKFLSYAIKPTGDTIKLIHIPKWDFRWQYFYTFPTMVPVPAGSEIVVEAVFDNTSGNPFNPNRPPVTVSERLDKGGSGMRTTDEMLQFIITYTLYKNGDENVSLKPRN